MPDQQPVPALERRTSVRYRLERPANSRLFIADSFKTLAAHVVDLSVEGVGIVLDQQVEIATRLHVDLPGAGDIPYELIADVLHVHHLPDGRWRCGCRLVWKLTEDEVRFLAKAHA